MEQQERVKFLADPMETRTIECKSWLDLSDNKNKAKLAKAAIAMANSGGGTIALGISEDNTNGKQLRCKPRPSGVARYDSDAVGSAINKYAEPELEPHLVFENHPDTGSEHAFVEIAGGMQQPVFAKKQLDGEIDKYACYIRKPGPPRSEVPHTTQEWQVLMTRCLSASGKSVLDRSPSEASPTPSEEDQLREFMATSNARWQECLQEVDEDDVARLKYGYWAFGFSILGHATWTSLNDLWDTLRYAVPGHHSDRFFEQDYREGPKPYAADEAIEAWIGHPNNGLYRSAYNSAFWRATLGGEFYRLEGFLEDSEFDIRPVEPGTRLYLDLTIQLHAMMVLLAARIAKSIGDEEEIVVFSQWNGVKGRYLTGSRNSWPRLTGSWRCSIDLVNSKPRRLAPQQIDDNLVEILWDFLHPMHEKFGIYDLKRGWVEAAVRNVKDDGW